MSHFQSPADFVMPSEAKQSRAPRKTLWIAASPAAPRNDEGVNQ